MSLLHDEVRYLPSKAGAIPVYKGVDGLWRVPDGTIIAYMDYGDGLTDPDPRCGAGVFTIPKRAKKLNKLCAIHDYMYSSRAYQAFHTREEADAYLERIISTAPELRWWKKIVGPLFRGLARVFGRSLWENSKTNV